MAGGWEFWIDRGGTFTDVVARAPNGALRTLKLLSENPSRYRDAAVEGIRRFLGIAPDAPVPAGRIAAVKMGTTVATNALLTRSGEPTALVITRGFADQLRIACQNRPRLFDLEIVLPELLYRRVIEADERVSVAGDVLRPLDEDAARAQLRVAYDDGLRAAAIVLMHAWRFPDHERRLAAVAREIGFTQVSASHAASPMMKLVSRGDTTVVDAYLSPILRRYVDSIASELNGAPLYFMQSSGGLTSAALFQGKDSILSGPAGGVVGAARTAEAAGYTRVIGFDMGGTSTDVCHYDGEFERAFDTLVAGVRMRAPMMAIHTVAAGGGSIVRFDQGRLRVGPDSAGAHPGPACYRNGGPLTVTDCNVMLGRIQPRWFPAVFGPDGDQPLDAERVAERFGTLAQEVANVTGVRRAPEEVAEGCIEIAVQNMANAIKHITISRGHDVEEYVLNAFGGAAGQHACRVADALGIPQVLIHPRAGVLSAYGLGLAGVTAMREQAVEAPLAEGRGRVEAEWERLEREARAELAEQGVGDVTVTRRAHLRYAGTDTALVLESGDDMAARFAERHRTHFGFAMPERPVMVEAVSVEASGGAIPAPAPPPQPASGTRPSPEAAVAMFCDGARRPTPLYRRAALAPGSRVDGPALIAEDNTTTVVDPGWAARIDAQSNLLLFRAVPRPRREALGTRADPVKLEVFNNLFMAIAEQMGVRLAHTAHSVNIKERLDFSCAIFDGEGRLIASAPHIPVHLGSMGETVQQVMRDNAGRMRPGDVYALNDPYAGGTHLPDITVVTPVFDHNGRGVLFYVGSRGHHADIGGITPGSMPPRSTRIEEEGVLLRNVLLVSGGEWRGREVAELLSAGPYPSRNVEQNLADLRAQAAANEKGAQELLRMVERYGLEVVRAYMGHVRANAAESVRAAIDKLDDGAFALEMDNGAVIRVAVTVDRAARRAKVDFTGTSPQCADNFNAPLAVTTAAVLYVFRTLVASDIPLNAGCLEPIDLVVPQGSLLNPRPPAAVVAGNVETSQNIADALYGALGVMAAAQGTMNNFTFGNARHQYYETIAGGAGAGPTFDGASGVQTHMTNSRLTDPEVLEHRYPVRVEEFALRRGSGGAGRHRGGDGVRRRIRFLEPMTAALLSGRRRIAPFGLAGGAPGATGRAWVERAGGRVEPLGATDETPVAAGDAIVIETPGGGGYGEPDDAPAGGGSR
ncbi:MAG: hydantoinase B/oxoprolinase family protein [Pseudomonadota bacterium]